MSKNIVLCFDGTGNEPGQNKDTNIFKISELLEKSDRQLVFYQSGVATGPINNFLKKIQFVTGAGLAKNIKNVYKILVENYSVGDRIYIFGFSRGAYAARSLAGMIARVGLLKWQNVDLVAKAYSLYSGNWNDRKINLFKSRNSTECAVHFIGVFDTVSSLLSEFFFRVISLLTCIAAAIYYWPNPELVGVASLLFIFFLTPQARIMARLLGIYHFHNSDLAKGPTLAFQALALDEQRRGFEPVLWNDAEDNRIEQVWFAGTHKDIGGPSTTFGFSDTALSWMLKKAAAHGIHLQPGYENKINPVSVGDFTKSPWPYGWPLTLKKRIPRKKSKAFTSARAHLGPRAQDFEFVD